MKQLIKRINGLAQQWSLLDQVVVSGGNFLLGIVLARWLGMENYGHYTLWYMVPLLALSLHQAAVVQPFQSLLATYPASRASAYGRQLWHIQLLLGGLLTSILLLGGLLSGNMLVSSVGLLAVLVCGHDYLRKYAFAYGYGQQAFFYDALLYSLIALALLWAYWSDWASLWQLFTLLDAVYGLLILWWSTRLKLNNFKLNRLGWAFILKTHYHFSFWLLGAALVQWWAGNGFLLAAAALLGPVVLASLRIAQQLVGICHVFFLAMENAAPVVAAQHFAKNGWNGLYKYLRQLSLRYALPVLVLLGGLAVAHQWLVTTIFGEAYAAHAYLVLAYAGLYVLVFLSIPLRMAVRTIQYNQVIFWVYASGALLSVLLAYPLIQTMGLAGVLWGLATVQLIGILLYGFTLFQYRNRQTTTFISAEN